MSATDVLDIIRESLIVTVKICAPLMLIALGVGLVISLIQSLTQIQEQTLTFVPKIITMFVGILVFLPFMLTTLTTFTHLLADRIVSLP